MNPFAGTGQGQLNFYFTGGNSGNTYPGANLPFGMIQWSPDTTPNLIFNQGGYSSYDRQILGFSLTHLSGAGCSAFEDISFMPILSLPARSPGLGRASFAASFAHDRESAAPGFYAVRFDDGIQTRLTVTPRTGIGMFSYPRNSDPTMLIDAGSSVNGASAANVRIDPARREVTGSATSGGFCGGHDHHAVYFVARFSRGFTAYGTWNGNALNRQSTGSEGKRSGAYLRFSDQSSPTVLVKVGISYVGLAGARANLQAEDPGMRDPIGDFQRVRERAHAAWNALLGRVQVRGGTLADTRTFYSMLYRALLFPSLCSDVNGQYVGFDGRVHIARAYLHYCNFSGWDIYRSQIQLVAMLAPRPAGDMAWSLVQDAREGGGLPLWSPANMNDNQQVGDPSIPIIADVYAFGATEFNLRAALDVMRKGAADPSAASNGVPERWGVAHYLRYGYLPDDLFGPAAVPTSLEYMTADFALARFARALGDSATYAGAMRRAQHWIELYDLASGFIQGRRSDGRFSPNFNLHAWLVEGDAIQYTWMVPFNLATLFRLMGGNIVAAARLDRFFTRLNDGPTSDYAFLGNEPTLETPWEYDWAGQPSKAQRVVRAAMLSLYSATPGGYPGNDDLGELSSWYVFGALGLYPEIPGDDVLAVAGPLFPRVMLRLAGGEIQITARGAGDQAPYIQSMTVNGKPWTHPWLRFADLARGAIIRFTMGSRANPRWGGNPGDAPPSYTAGLASAGGSRVKRQRASRPKG